MKRFPFVCLFGIIIIAMSLFSGCEHVHSYSDQWSSDDSYHWHKATCVHTDEIRDKTEHIFVDNKCTECRYRKEIEFTESLQYKLNNDGESYSVVGIGSSKDSVLYIPATYNDKPVTTIGANAFESCANLKSIVIPEGIITICDMAFINCINLEKIIIPNSLKNLGLSVFDKYYTKMEYAEYDNARYIGNESNPYLILIGALDSEISSCNIKNNTRFINDDAFFSCNKLQSIIIPTNVTSIGADAFFGCESLAYVSIPDGLTYLGDYAFDGCNLEYNEYDNGLYVGNDNNPYLVLIKAKNYQIASCMVNEKTKFIYSGAFFSCSILQNITIPNSVIGIGNSAFSICEGLESIIIPNSVTSIGNGAFGRCKSLIDIVIPDSVTNIDAEVFAECSKLASVTFGISIFNIKDFTFRDCVSLTAINYNGTIEQWERIEKNTLNAWNFNTGEYTIHCIDGDIEKGE